MAFQIKFLVVFIVGAVCLIAGGVLYALFPKLIHDQVVNQVQLKPDKMIYEIWKTLPLPIYLNFYFFNTTNADDVIKNGAKPNLQEVGPYSYKETRYKTDVKFIVDDGTASYKQIKTYFFEKGNSCQGCDETDKITVPNIPIVAMVTVGETRSAKDKNRLKTALNLKKPTLYRTQSVKELTFDGYYDELVDMAQKQIKQVFLPNAKFGFLYGQNATDDGVYVVNRGLDDPEKFTKVVSWQSMTEMPYWPENSTCAMINGTDGFQYAPFVTKDTVLRMFVPEVYRSVFVVYEQESETKGIDTLRFSLTFDLFGDQTLTPENKCFSLKEDFLPSGVHDVSPARFGAPVFVSYPHFYQGDPTYLLTVSGLHPLKDKHGSLLDIEPTTGAAVNAVRRLQLNVRMRSPEYLMGADTPFANMPELLYPIAWIEEGATIDDANADKVFEMLILPKRIGTGVMYALMAVGSVLIVVAIGLIFLKKKSVKTSPSQQKIFEKTAL